MYSSNLGRHFSSTSGCSVSCKKSISGFSSSITCLISVSFSPFCEYSEPPMFMHPTVNSFLNFGVGVGSVAIVAVAFEGALCGALPAFALAVASLVCLVVFLAVGALPVFG